MDPSERRTVLVRLASLLLEAAGVATAERDDDEPVLRVAMGPQAVRRDALKLFL